MYGLSDELKPISAAEEQVMLALWRTAAPASRYDIGRALRLPGGTTWADATLLNFLYRLEEKGWVKSGKQGNRNVYTPLVPRRVYAAAAMRERLATLFDGSLPDAVRALSADAGADRASLEQADAVLQELLTRLTEYDPYS